MANPLVRSFLFYTGVFTPGIIALALTYRERGSPGIQSLIRRLVKFDVGGRWLAFALFFMAALKLLAALMARLTSGVWPASRLDLLALMFAAALFSTFTGGQIGEELGWRGYALPRLARPRSLAGASLLLGVIWAAWHLPLFFMLGGDTVGQSFPFYLLQVIAISVVMAWLYMKTNGSLFATMLLHAAVNNTKDVVPSALSVPGNPWQLRASPVGWWTIAILWLCAAWMLYDMRGNTTVARFAGDE